MARADLLKKLFWGYQRRDNQAFQQAAEELILEERKKQHLILANELERILRNGFSESNAARTLVPMDPGPLASERKMALLEVRQPQRYMEDLVLEPAARATVERIILEFREWEVLKWKRAPRLRADSQGDRNLHVVVGCQKRFETGLDPKQSYGLVVNFWHSGQEVQLYQDLRALIPIRVRVQP